MNTNTPSTNDAVICPCSGTRRSNIESLFEQGMDLEAISRWTGAVSGCGGCEWEIAELLKTLAAQKSDAQHKNGV